MIKDLESFLRDCSLAESLGDLEAIMVRAAAAHGLPMVACGFDGPSGLVTSNLFMLHNYPPGWLDFKSRKGSQFHDPIPHFARLAGRPFSWEEHEFLAALTDRHKRYLRDARSFGIACGYSIPLAPGLFDTATFTAFSPDGDITSEQQLVAQFIGCIVFHCALVLSFRASARHAIEPLSPQQRACLTARALGDSDEIIGRDFGISADTVRSHLNRAARRLGAATREQLVCRALATGQMG